MSKFINVKEYKTSLGHWCNVTDCHKSAYVKATRVGNNGIKLPMRYCPDHARERGAIK